MRRFGPACPRGGMRLGARARAADTDGLPFQGDAPFV